MSGSRGSCASASVKRSSARSRFPSSCRSGSRAQRGDEQRGDERRGAPQRFSRTQGAAARAQRRPVAGGVHLQHLREAAERAGVGRTELKRALQHAARLIRIFVRPSRRCRV